MEKIAIQYKHSDYRKPWTEWEWLCDADDEDDAIDTIAYLKREDERERAAGFVGTFEKSAYRWVRITKIA